MSTHDLEDADDLDVLAERVADLEAQLEELEEAEDQTTKMSIIAVHGSLDMAYPTLLLSSMAAAFDWDVTVFASFWALDLLHEEKSKNLKLSALDPKMPVPNALAVLPGMDSMATWMMERKIDDINTDTVEELIQRGIDNGVEFQACEMTADLMDYEDDDFFDEVTTGVGAATALMDMSKSDIQLVI